MFLKVFLQIFLKNTFKNAFPQIFSETLSKTLPETPKKKTLLPVSGMGPKGSPGMPEMLRPTSLISGYGLENKIAFLTDGRFSGGSCGFIIGHITPEYYQQNSPLARVLCLEGHEVVLKVFL